eukprot:1754858-Pyramimonas_sp.AAC.1
MAELTCGSGGGSSGGVACRRLKTKLNNPSVCAYMHAAATPGGPRSYYYGCRSQTRCRGG